MVNSRTLSCVITQRYRARMRQRGAAIFVVLMVVTLLSTLGLFALRSASMATRSSGFNRQATQVHYVSDFAVTSMAAFLNANMAQIMTLKMTGQQMDTTCVGFGTLQNPTCAKVPYDSIEGAVKRQQTLSNLLEPATSTPGSLGPVPLEADFAIEVTDWHEAWPPPAGNDANSTIVNAMVTVSVRGMVRPEQVVADTWDLNAATAAGVESARAHLIFGPVTQ